MSFQEYREKVIDALPIRISWDGHSLKLPTTHFYKSVDGSMLLLEDNKGQMWRVRRMWFFGGYWAHRSSVRVEAVVPECVHSWSRMRHGWRCMKCNEQMFGKTHPNDNARVH
jgi:hypothetical protein